MKATRYLEYLEAYVERFHLRQHIHLSTPVISIRRRGTGHVVRYGSRGGEEENEWHCDAVAICSGLHVTPAIPEIPGMERVPSVMHSSQFKGRKDFADHKTVVVLGVGETGMDISYMAVNTPTTERVVLCHKHGWVNAPKLLPETDFFPYFNKKPAHRDQYANSPGVPLDVAHSSIFDSSYVHRIVRDSMIPWNFHHYVMTGLAPWVLTGTFGVWDQWVGKPREANHHVSRTIFVKSNQAVWHINPPYKTLGKGSIREWLRAKLVRTPNPDLHGRLIDVAPWPTHVDDTGQMHFEANDSPEYERIKDQTIRPDLVIFSTGYRQEMPFLFGEPDDDGNHHRPYPTLADAKVRHIWAPDDPTVAFIGFLRPQIGAIPPVAEMQAMLWTLTLIERLAPEVTIPGLRGERLPQLKASEQWHYMLLPKAGERISYGIDHDSYVAQLAKDMDCDAGVGDLLRISWRRGWRRGWNLLPAWMFVSQVNTKFRLRGPWKWEGGKENAAEVVHTELWSIVQRNGGFIGVVLQTAVPFAVFGALNLGCWVYGGVMGLFGVKVGGPYTPKEEFTEESSV